MTKRNDSNLYIISNMYGTIWALLTANSGLGPGRCPVDLVLDFALVHRRIERSLPGPSQPTVCM